MDAAGDIGEWMRANFEFHSTLYALADRPHSESILRSLLNSVQPYSQEHIEKLGGRSQASVEHFDMVQAIRDGDADELARLFLEHLGTARKRLSDSFAQDSPGDPLKALRGLAV
jgi:DNA-binding GntR family transcriptional regulator